MVGWFAHRPPGSQQACLQGFRIRGRHEEHAVWGEHLRYRTEEASHVIDVLNHVDRKHGIEQTITWESGKIRVYRVYTPCFLDEGPMNCARLDRCHRTSRSVRCG